MSFLSDYEKRMLKNREENKKVLASLGLNKPFFPFLHAQSKPATKGIKRKRTEDEKPRKAQRKSADSLQATRELVQSSEDDWRTKYGRRRSGRLMGKEPGDLKDLDLEVEEEDDDDNKPKRVPTRNRENVFGPIPDIEVGTTWSTRLACSADGVHRPTVAGIHGNAVEGCYSLALSGGYEDDLDYGDCFTYTGEGGRDLKGTKANPKNLRTAPQSKDQTLTRGNLALTKNIEKGRPVRVIRGYKLDSPFAPEEGYRYDGLYSVEKYWQAVGLSGFMVYKFVLKRCDNQPPAVWHINKEEEEDDNDGSDVHEEEVLEKTSPKDSKPESPAEPANSGKDHHSTNKVDENVMMKNGGEKSGAQHTEKNNMDANEIGDKSNSKLEGDEHSDVDDDNRVVSTSGQAVGDDANDGDDDINNGNDDADEHQVTNTTKPQGITEETDVKTKQSKDGRNDVDVDGNLVSTEQGSGEKDDEK